MLLECQRSESKFAYLHCQFLKARWNAKAKFSLVKLFFETVPAQIFSVTAWNMSEGKSEVFLWLRSISNGLGLERLAEDFESRGFRKTSSLKYIRSSDLDVLFPSPHKLLLAEKRIIETELEQLKRQENPGQKAQTLPPRELFPSTSQGSRESSVSSPTQASNLVLFNNVYSAVTNTGTVSANIESETAEEKKAPQVCNQTSSYLQKRETELKQDSELLAAQILSVRDLLTEKTRAFENYENGSTGRQKLCTLCHTAGHNKNKCSNGPCKGISFCNNRDKHPEVRAEIQELKKVVKDLEKRQEKSKNEFDIFKAARERAASSFFAVMRPRLRKQNHIKYVDRSALDKDLMILKKALGNKIPLDERMDWELPYIIERYKRSNVDIFSPVLNLD